MDGLFWAKRKGNDDWELVLVRDGEVYTMGWDVGELVEHFTEFTEAVLKDPDGNQHTE